MPRRKRFEVKVNVSLPAELADWLDEMVRKGVFSSLSHGIRRCIAIAKEYLPQIQVEVKKVETKELKEEENGKEKEE